MVGHTLVIGFDQILKNLSLPLEKLCHCVCDSGTDRNRSKPYDRFECDHLRIVEP